MSIGEELYYRPSNMRADMIRAQTDIQMENKGIEISIILRWMLSLRAIKET